MQHQDFKTIIGYSAYIHNEECFEYIENACYIGNNVEKVKDFMDNYSNSVGNYRIDTIYLQNIINDFGCSLGEYAMETKAFSSFKEIAERNTVKYSSEKFDLDTSFTIVEIEK
ncbi:MAG: hypothetical protein K8S23_07475 [Candidatus Cloacimonetes bacterium]|nr:hypothetical protein [Candidatus Cloacimonadota bacterium]